MNITLLRKIQKTILLNPHQFNMNWWFHGTDSKGVDAICGTAACIGGWAMALTCKQETLAETRRYYEPRSFSKVAMQLLELEPSQAQRLFLERFWPAEYQAQNAKTAQEAAELAAARIGRFIDTNGEE